MLRDPSPVVVRTEARPSRAVPHEDTSLLSRMRCSHLEADTVALTCAGGHGAILGSISDENDNGDVSTAIMRSLGELLREARTGRFTIEELARRSNVSAGRISQIERGLAGPSFETLWRLCSALDVSIASLFPSGGPEPQLVVRKNERRRLTVILSRSICRHEHRRTIPGCKGALRGAVTAQQRDSELRGLRSISPP